MKKHELLAPAGGKAQLIAAINAGADAVYLGGQNFNARANAHNFNTDEIKWALDFSHARGVKIYVTMNTLLSDAGLLSAFKYANFLYEEGADALIVQDLGLAAQVKKFLPEIEIHLSTQGTIYNAEGVKAAKELGFKRIVLARETTLDEIRELSAVTDVNGGVEGGNNGVESGNNGVESVNGGIEIEAFVHGALCICYSGQCQMSRHIGGRSGNKGSCAQPCRLPYVSQYASQFTGKYADKYSLSPKDLCTVEFLGELCDAGVLSFKIEGRMKSPEYVAIVTSIYRKYLDMAIGGKTYRVSQEDKYALNQIFNRGGFTSGYYHGVQSHKKFMSADFPKHQGVYVGQVHDRREGSVFVDVDALPDMSINLGDGIEIRSKELAGNIVTYHKKLKNGLLRIGDIKGKIQPGDKVYKITDKSLMKEARVFFEHQKDLRKSYINMTFKASLGEYPVLEVFENSPAYVEDRLNANDFAGDHLQKDGSAFDHLHKDWSAFDLLQKDGADLKVRIVGEVKAERAEKTPTTKETIVKQLSKTGGTPFAIAGSFGTCGINYNNEIADIKDEIVGIKIEIEDGILIPTTELNKMRRHALDALELMKIKRAKRTPVGELAKHTPKPEAEVINTPEAISTPEAINTPTAHETANKAPQVSLFFYRGSDVTPEFIKQKIAELEGKRIRCDDIKIFVPLHYYMEHMKTDVGATGIIEANGIIENEKNKILIANHLCKYKIIPYISNISKGKLDDYIRKNFNRIVERCKDSGISIGNLGWIREFSAKGIFVYGDYGLNVTNDFAHEAILQLGVKTLASKSMEVSEGNFGKLPLMISEFIFEQDYLIDRKGVRYSIIKNEFGDKSIILSEEVPLNFGELKKLQETGASIRIYY